MRPLRVVLYTHAALFEPALSLVAELSTWAEVHLLLEVPAGSWRIASFEVPPQTLPRGLVEADPVLAAFYPPAVREMWRAAASFHLVVHGELRSRDTRSLRLTLGVLDWIAGIDADVLHVDDVDVSSRLAAGLALRGRPCPVLMGCHDPDPHSGEIRWRGKQLTRLLAFSASDAVLVHHEAGRSALEARHPRLRIPVYAVRLGTYDFLRQMGSADQRAAQEPAPTVLLFGRITPYKGVEQLFDAAPLVSRSVPGLRVVVAGKPVPHYQPPPPPQLERGGRIEVRYEYIPASGIARLCQEAAVMVCPYTDASQSGVVLTSYAFGLPVVATDVGGMSEYIRDGSTGFVVPPADSKALAAALVRCLRDPELLSRLRSGVAAANDSWSSWGRVSTEVATVYRSVANRRRRARRSPVRWRRRPHRSQADPVPEAG